MAEPNLPLNIPLSQYPVQVDGVDDSGLIENKQHQGFSQTHRGRGRKNVGSTVTGSTPAGTIRYDETQ